jgi:hypothetical protein
MALSSTLTLNLVLSTRFGRFVMGDLDVDRL